MSKLSIMSINNYLLFQFIKLYLHDEEKFNKFDYSKYKESSNYGLYGSYGGFKWSDNKDISNGKKLDFSDFDKPMDPLDTIFMFHDYKLSISKSKWDSFTYNKDAASSVLYLSRNYRIINLLSCILYMPIICIFSLTCTVHQTKYDKKNEKVIKLDSTFRDKLKLYYESNDENAYEILLDDCKNIFLEFEKIYLLA